MIKKISITILLLLLTGFTLKAGLGAELKESDKLIYDYEIVDDIRCDDVCVNHGQVMQYKYKKETKDVKRNKTKKINLNGEEVDMEFAEVERDYNRITYETAGTSTKVTEFFMGVQFIKEIATGDWYELEAPATTTIEEWNNSKVSKWYDIFFGRKAMATVSTFYPDPSPENTSVDGFVENDTDASCNWTDARNGTGACSNLAANDSGTSLQLVARENAGDTDRFQIDRMVILFDTSALPDSDVISAATLDIRAQGSFSNQDDDGDNYIAVVSSSPSSNTAVTSADYSNFGTTEFSDQISLNDIVTSGYETWTLNASGIAAIDNTGVSKFGMREGHDILNNQIANNAQNSWTGLSADNGGTGSDPFLTVTHATAPAVTDEVADNSQIMIFGF